MSYSYQFPDRKNKFSDEEIQDLARRFFKTPKVLHDIVLVRVPIDDDNCPQVMRCRKEAQQESINHWQTKAREDDLCLRIERRWIPHKCVFVPDTEIGRKFQKMAVAIAQIPMQADVRPKNQNQAYWLKTQHYLYQARGLLMADEIFNSVVGNDHLRELLRNSVGLEETQKIEQLAAVDSALYQLIKAVTPKLCDETACCTIEAENNTLKFFVEIQKQTFIEGWNAGPENFEQTWVSLKDQEDYYLKQIRFLRKLGEPLLPREEIYLEEIAQTGQYWEVLSTAVLSDPWLFLDKYAKYIKALTAAKNAYISDISWHRGQPFKLERSQERAMFKPRHRKCSTIKESECDCPFRHIGTDLGLSHCLKVAQQEIEPLRRAHAPRPIKGIVNLRGFIVWIWA
ncbi:MAG: hypothetical protein F6K04_01170 [Leptolyngbya sp. SIO4C5]|nr:hypothetical protein [Leptolyngbya sp. SIO4C5]